MLLCKIRNSEEPICQQINKELSFNCQRTSTNV